MNTSTNDKINVARWIAWIAAGFTFIMAILLIANFVQTKLNDPIDNKTIPALVKRLSQDPADEALKVEIRAFDLIARKAYFTSQWQLRTGSYLLVLGVIVVILAVRFILSSKSKLNTIDSIEKVNGLDHLIAQKWMIYTGSGLILIALASGFLSSNSLKTYMVNENLVAKDEIPVESVAEVVQEQTVVPVDSAASVNNTTAPDSIAASGGSVIVEGSAVSVPVVAAPAG